MGFLKGKTVIITGADEEGLAIASAFAEEGANLTVIGSNRKKLQEWKAEWEERCGIRALTFRGEIHAGLDNEAIADHVVRQTAEAFGDIHVLIHHAQMSAAGVPLAEHTVEQFNLAVYSGLYAAFYYMRACYPYLAKTGGSVINFAAGAERIGKSWQSARAAAGEGICGLSRAAAAEWEKDGIRVYAVRAQECPQIGGLCVRLAAPDCQYPTGETIVPGQEQR